MDEDDREDLLAQIDELTEKIELEFGKLIDKVLSSFWDSGVDHNRVIVTLIGKEKLLKEEDLAGTRNIDDVFKIIRPYCSYFNYDLIEMLIKFMVLNRLKHTLKSIFKPSPHIVEQYPV